MKLEIITKDQFYEKVQAARMAFTTWRHGQAVFNVMYSIFPNIAERLVDTKCDPFYKDENVEVFVNKCFEIIEGGK